MILVPIAAIGIALAYQSVVDRKRWWLAALFTALCVVENFESLGTVDRIYVEQHVASIVQKVDPSSKAFFLVGTNKDVRWVADDAAWVTLATGIPTINGRYGNFPSGYDLKEYAYGMYNDKNLSRKEAKLNMEEALQCWLDTHGIKREDVQCIEYETLEKITLKPYRND
ncbi:MAG: hypothetical protein HRT89_25470 [Lentisphaeria bacterium]|nr:hypothetical protein [Lentisphaeria bacterium]